MKTKNKKSNSEFITIRHFCDQNALREYGHDAKLKPGQDILIKVTSGEVINEAKKQGKKIIRFLYTNKTRRIKETAEILSEILRQKGFNVKLEHDSRLEVMDQGELILPDNYKDGEWFDPLDVAWDVICDEAYLKQNIFYRFGDDLKGKYPILAKSFSRVGESLGWSLINKYSFIFDLANNKFSKEDELLVIVSQSDLPLLIMELQALEGRVDVTQINLPYKSWEVYKSGLQNKMYDKNATGDGNFDIPMGYIGKFDLSSFVKSGFDITIKNVSLLLSEKIKL